MATIKSYTDISQSKKLAEILPLESADMYYCYGMNIHMKEWSFDNTPTIIDNSNRIDVHADIPCWSLAALLGVLNKSAYFANEAGIVELSSIKATKWCVSILNCGKIENCYADEPVDACYEMIIKLHERNLL